jgi:hypothetical protein
MEHQNKDPEIWKSAQERAGFKMHVTIFFIVNAFFWVVWAFIGYIYDWEYDHPWPLYPMLLWGLGLLLHYLFVYKWKKKITVREYEKLMKKKIR